MDSPAPAAALQASSGPETPLPIKPNLKLASLHGVQSPGLRKSCFLCFFFYVCLSKAFWPGFKRFPLGGASTDILGDADVDEDEVAREKVAAYPPRTLAHPYVGEKPLSHPALSFSQVAASCVLPSTLFKVQTADTPLDDFVLPIDDTVDPDTYVGDWEELFIRTYARVFSRQEHQLYWCAKSDIGPFVTAVAKPVEGFGHPTLSLGPNGYHFAYLPAVSPDVELPAPKHLTRLFPHFEECKFTYAKEGDKLAADLLSFEEKMKPTRYKFGLLYVREGQTEENQFYGNVDPSVGFIEFCKILGSLVELRGHTGYRGGLDVKGDTTGELSLYTKVQLADGRFVGRGGKLPADAQEIVDLEIMFHVAPFLPHSSEKDDQQLHKKRHLGNDIVIIVYKEGTTRISPDVFKSQFNHVFIIVTPCSPNGGSTATHYKIEVVTKGLKRFLPQLPESQLLPAERLCDWMLLKLINAEVTAMRSKDFRLKMKRTRVQTLESWMRDREGSRK